MPGGGGAGNISANQQQRSVAMIDQLRNVLTGTVGGIGAQQLMNRYTEKWGGARNFNNMFGAPHVGMGTEIRKLQKYMDGGGGADSHHIARINKLHTTLMGNSEDASIPIVGASQNTEGGGFSPSINPGNPIFQLTPEQAKSHWSRFDEGEIEELSKHPGSINPYETPKPSDTPTVDAVKKEKEKEKTDTNTGYEPDDPSAAAKAILAYNKDVDRANRKAQKKAGGELKIGQPSGPQYEPLTPKDWQKMFPRRETSIDLKIG